MVADSAHGSLAEMGELLTRATIWLAMTCYGVTEWLMLDRRWQSSSSARWRWARWFWTTGFLFFFAHVVLAFACFYQWSHAVGVQQTAERTEEVVGWRIGWGIYFNYLLGFFWLIDVLAWWRIGRNYTQTWGQLRLYLRYYFAFMMFNGGVVFTTGWVRIYGGLLFAILAAKLIYVRWSAAGATSERDRDRG